MRDIFRDLSRKSIEFFIRRGYRLKKANSDNEVIVFKTINRRHPLAHLSTVIVSLKGTNVSVYGDDKISKKDAYDFLQSITQNDYIRHRRTMEARRSIASQDTIQHIQTGINTKTETVPEQKERYGLLIKNLEEEYANGNVPEDIYQKLKFEYKRKM